MRSAGSEKSVRSAGTEKSIAAKVISSSSRIASSVVQKTTGGLKDSMLEVKASVIKKKRSPEELIAMPTPKDRWWTPERGWPGEVADLQDDYVPYGHKVAQWRPPRTTHSARKS